MSKVTFERPEHSRGIDRPAWATHVCWYNR